jgi:Ca2+:H+ antiporter
MRTMMRAWTWFVPLLSIVLLVTALAAGVGPVLGVLCGATLFGAVIAAVHHAEVVAHRVGEPLGTLVLALAVTAIETALILSMMVAGGDSAATLPRDTIYAAVMIICNGVVGFSVLVGGLKHREQSFRIEGAGVGLAALMVMSSFTLVLPVFTTTTGPGTYSTAQLVFVAVSSATLWALFGFIQTVRHRDYFMPAAASRADEHADPPTVQEARVSGVLLLLSLIGTVGLAKVLSPIIEEGVEAAHAPQAVVGIVIATLILLPEATAAIRAARANRLQSSMNLAIGSALASIGLTIPFVVMASVLLNLRLTLGLEPKDMAMLTLTFLVSTMTLGTGRTHMMQGAVHLVIFAAFLVFAFVP